MSAKRYFQLSYLWPVLLPVVILALPGPFVPNWIQQFCSLALRWAGIPYALFAAAVVLWSWNKETAAARRSTYIAPLLFSPVLCVYLFLAGGASATYRSGPGEFLVLVVIYGLFLVFSVITLGYTYVGLINLIFVLLRSTPLFQEDWESAMAVSQDAGVAVNVRPGALMCEPASQDPRINSPGQAASAPLPAGTPYCFVSWEDEKLKGSSTTKTANPADTVNPGDAPASPASAALEMQAAPPPSVYQPAPVIPAMPRQKAPSLKPRAIWDPVRAAALAFLLPLIMLSGFAIYRQYALFHRTPAASHRIGDRVAGENASQKSRARNTDPH